MDKNNQKNDYQDVFNNEEYNENNYYKHDSKQNDNSEKLDSNDEFNFKKMDKNRRTAFIILGVFSVLVIVIWFINFRSNLRGPFNYSGKISENSSNNNSCPDGNCSNNTLTSSNLDLKLVDTDGDSISDWDELFIYGTSPYLEDTDGDKLTDHEEIFVYKTNVLCPEGQDCSGSITQTESQNVSNSDSLNNFASFLEKIDNDSNTSTDKENPSNNLDSKNIDAKSLRNILIEDGFSESDLNNINDDDLIKMYQEVLDNL